MKAESDGPKRKVFHILDEGRQAFLSKLSEMLTDPMPLKQDVDVAITFGGLLKPEIIKSALKEYKNKVENNLQMYQTEAVQSFGEDPNVLRMLRRSILHMEADLEWVNEVLSQ